MPLESPHRPIDFLLLDQYLAGTDMPDTRMAVEQWMAESPVHATLVAMAHTGRRDGTSVRVDVERALERLRRAQQADAVRTVSPQEQREQGTWLGRRALRHDPWLTATALAVGVIVMIAGWMLGTYQVQRHTATEMLTYTTGNGERATIALPDGGKVVLNVASRLDVPMDYMAGNHTLRLTGEGFFTLSHYDGTPATVIAGATQVRVLGTSFLVRRYATDTTVLVAVRDGKVAIGPTVVTTKQMATVARDGVLKIRSSDASLFTFMSGALTINGLSLPAAIVELDRWFDADIRLGDPKLKNQFVKGTFAAGSIGDLAEILELTFNVRVVRNGRVLTLFPEG